MLNIINKLIAFKCTKCNTKNGKRGQLKIIPINQKNTICSFCGHRLNITKSNILFQSDNILKLRNAYDNYSKYYVL